MLEIKNIDNKKTWEEFLLRKEIDFYPLFQSWNWGEVQEKLGNVINRIGLFDGKELIGVCLFVKIKAKRGTYFHLRHAPVLNTFESGYFDFLIGYIKKLAKKEQASFIRISPLIEEKNLEVHFFSKKGFLSAPIHNQDAEICWILDITKSEEELLKSMRKTHRYLIKKAQTMDIKITQTNKISEIDKFVKFYNTFSRRKHFVPHKGIREEFEVFSKDNQVVLFTAEYEGEVISASIVLFIAKMAIYHHSASSDKYSNVPASYLIQWRAILEAKKRGIPIYNFWGIAPQGKNNHPWQGLTLFKTGFGGHKKEFVHAKDLPLSILYCKAFVIEYIRKIKRGY